MSKTRRVKAQDSKHITRTECHALIVHVINQVFAQMAEPDVVSTDDPAKATCDEAFVGYEEIGGIYEAAPYADAGEGAE